jgi:hypothetical protein
MMDSVAEDCGASEALQFCPVRLVIVALANQDGALGSAVIHYRGRGATHEVAKALGLLEDVAGITAKASQGSVPRHLATHVASVDATPVLEPANRFSMV